MNIHLVLANDFEHVDGQLMLSSDAPDLTAITLYETAAALAQFGVTCTWQRQKPARTMTAQLLGLVSWDIIQGKLASIPQLFTDRLPTAKVTLDVTPILIQLDIVLPEAAMSSLYQHGAPLFQ